MSVPTPKASDAKSDLRAITITLEKNAPLRIVKELMKNTGLLSVEGNFEFVDFAADCPSPIPMWTGGCQFRVPPAPLAGDEPKPPPHLTLSLDKQVRSNTFVALDASSCCECDVLLIFFLSANGFFFSMSGLRRLSLAGGRGGLRRRAPI